MYVWVVVEAQPILSFYSVQEAKSRVTGLSYQRLTGVGDINRPLAVNGNAENANATVTVDNSDGRLTQFFTNPPLRSRTTILGFIDGEVVPIFNGVVTGIDIGPEITLSLEF